MFLMVKNDMRRFSIIYLTFLSAFSLCTALFLHFFLMFAVHYLNSRIFLLVCSVSAYHTSRVMYFCSFLICILFFYQFTLEFCLNSLHLLPVSSCLMCFHLKFCLYRFYLCVVSIHPPPPPFPMSSLCKECMTWHDFPLKTQGSCLNDGWNDLVTEQGQLCRLWHYNLLQKLSSSNRREGK